jgi:hypothetical protein
LGGRNNPDNPDDPEASAAMDGMDDPAVTLDHHAERDGTDLRKGRSAVQSCHLTETLRCPQGARSGRRLPCTSRLLTRVSLYCSILCITNE